MPKRIFLGVTDYFGEKARAYREVHSDRWLFVLQTIDEEIVLIEY